MYISRLSSPWVLIIYSIIALWSIIAFIWEGKAMAKHDMAAKKGMSTNVDVKLTGKSDDVNDEDDYDRPSCIRRTSIHPCRDSMVGDVHGIVGLVDPEVRSMELGASILRNSSNLISLPERFYFGESSFAVDDIIKNIERMKLLPHAGDVRSLSC